jgi:hypothetical protein
MLHSQTLVLLNKACIVAAYFSWFELVNLLVSGEEGAADVMVLWAVATVMVATAFIIAGYFTWIVALQKAELAMSEDKSVLHARIKKAQEVMLNARMEVIKGGCRIIIVISVFSLDNAVRMTMSDMIWETWVYVGIVMLLSAVLVFASAIVLAFVRLCVCRRCCMYCCNRCCSPGSRAAVFELAKKDTANQLVYLINYALQWSSGLSFVSGLTVFIMLDENETRRRVWAWLLVVVLYGMAFAILHIQRRMLKLHEVHMHHIGLGEGSGVMAFVDKIANKAAEVLFKCGKGSAGDGSGYHEIGAATFVGKCSV